MSAAARLSDSKEGEAARQKRRAPEENKRSQASKESETAQSIPRNFTNNNNIGLLLTSVFNSSVLI